MSLLAAPDTCQQEKKVSDKLFVRVFLDQLIGNVEDGVLAARQGQFDTVFIALPMKAEARIRDILFRLGDTTADVQLIPNFFMFSMILASLRSPGGSKSQLRDQCSMVFKVVPYVFIDGGWSEQPSISSGVNYY